MENKSDFLLGCLVMVFTYTLFKLMCWAVLKQPRAVLPKEISSDYTKRIVVDSSEKIEQAISNAVYDVKKRDFAVIKLNLEKSDSNFIIKCSGKEKGNLLEL